MHRLQLMILTIGLSFHINAVNYSNQQLNDMINDEANAHASEFVRGFFTSNDPKHYLRDFINNNRSSDGQLVKEYQLYTLLSEISKYPQQPFLKQAVVELTNYQSTAFKNHDEGNMELPIYDIHNRAVGIENMWFAQQSLNHFSSALNQNPVATLLTLKDHINDMTNPEWLGLKQSLDLLSENTHQQIRNFLLNNSQFLSELGKLISHYALISADEELVKLTLNHVDKKHGEYVLRHLSKYFTEGFVVDTLINSVQQSKFQQFAMSLMSAVVDDHEEVRSLLLMSVANPSLSHQAAFALSQTSRNDTIQKMYEQFLNSKDDFEKNSLLLALKMNKHQHAKNIVNDIKKSELTEMNRTWLSSFNGVVQ